MYSTLNNIIQIEAYINPITTDIIVYTYTCFIEILWYTPRIIPCAVQHWILKQDPIIQ